MGKNIKPEPTPTVSRVHDDTLIDLVFAPDTRTTSLAVSRFGGLWNLEQEVRVGTGEILVPYSAHNSLISSGCILLASTPVDYGFKHELIADIEAFLYRYVDLSLEFQRIAAYYVLLTWVYDAFSEVPYLRLRGDFGTGKTRALMAIGSLCYKPFFASGASTVSPIFHTLDSFGGTLILDEADLPFSDAKADLVKILNNGSVRGMPVLRTMVNRYKEFNPYAFKVFGPKIIATRELFQDDALESRFITEETLARTLRPDIPIHLPESLKSEALALRNRLLHFRLCEFFKVKTDATALIADASPRLNQTVLSLLSLVDDAEHRRTMQGDFLQRAGDFRKKKDDGIDQRILRATLAVFSSSKAGTASIGAILREFNENFQVPRDEAMTPRKIGLILRNRFRVETRKTGGVYVIPASERQKLTAVTARYAA